MREFFLTFSEGIMSIQLRLNLAIALLSALGLICMISFILIDAKPRMDVENASTMLLTETLIRASLVPLLESNDPKDGLHRLIGELKYLRHASVSLASHKQDVNRSYQSKIENTWLSGWNGLHITPLRIPLEVHGQLLDTIVITPRPGDEFSELLETIFRIFEWGAVISVFTLALTWLIINRSLRPVHTLRDAMLRMSSGEFNLRVPEVGPPEIKSICGSLNVLAAALQVTRQDNKRLTADMIMIQDEERRDIARELHDELGPYLFTMRTEASLISRELEKPEIDQARVQRLNGEILGHLDLLQQTNRRVLERLTPAGLAELGLSGALRAMIEMWRRNKNGVDLDFSIEGNIDGLDETRKLTVYRVVQEGLTNAFRHSGASHIEVSVSLPVPVTSSAAQHERILKIIIRDNGRGRDSASVDGFGIRAMRERVCAMAGSLAIDTAEHSGTSLDVSLPAAALPTSN